jgi:hypothetical protein
MMRRHAIRLPVLAGLVALLCVRSALAQNAACSSMTIDADASVDARWRGLVSQVREALDARDDIDRCASVRLTLREASIAIEVTLPDGRSAIRSVSRREDVVSTIEALLVLPRRPVEPETSAREPSASPSAPVITSIVPARAIDRASPPTLFPASRPSRLRIELSLITGARIGDGQRSFGVGALSFLEIDGWLVGFEGRGDRYQTVAGDRDGAALELAVLGGRRFRFRNLALDVVAGPAAAIQGTATFETRTSTGNTVSASSSSTVPRLLVGTRLAFDAFSTLHTFIGIDGELGPSRRDDVVPGASHLPLWTLGIALGGTVGTH